MKLEFEQEDINLLEQYWIQQSRVNFYAYRQFLHYENIKLGWFVQDFTQKLQDFYVEYKAGLCPIYIFITPPQHGKSSAVVDLISWVLGSENRLQQDIKIIYTAFSDQLSTRTNHQIQRIAYSNKYSSIFPNIELPTLSDKEYSLNSYLIEIKNTDSSFRNTTISGAVTGESLDIGIIDDPIKGREKANSQDHRNKVWDHLTDDFFTRFSEKAALLMTLTSWHIDDPAHRLIKAIPDAKLFKYKAIAEEDESCRQEGEALFPEHKSLEFLLKRKQVLSKPNWLALYQGSPVVEGGNLFKIHHFREWTKLPPIKYKFIVSDTAQRKKETNDFTNFQLWGYGFDGNIYLMDHINERMTAPELRRGAVNFWNLHSIKRVNINDPTSRKFWVESKSSGIGLLQELEEKQIPIGDLKHSTDKILRATDATPHIEAGKVYLNSQIRDVDIILDQAVQFPNGIFDDAIDNLMNAVEAAYILKDDMDDLLAAMEAS